MMERVTASQAPRWVAGVLAGVVTVSGIAMPFLSIPAARAAEHRSLPGSSGTVDVPVSTAPEGAPASFLLLAAVPAVEANPSAGANRVTGVELVEVGPMSATLLIETDQPVESYESFSLPDPARVVIDIPDAVHATRAAWPARGPVSGIRASQYKSRPTKVVRIVLDLASELPYRVQADPGPFRVLIGEAVAEAVRLEGPPTEASARAEVLPQAPAPAEEVAVPPSMPEGRVKGVDYQPKDGQAEMLIRTSGEVAYHVSEVSTPPRLILDVGGAVIDPQAAKVLDVRELPGPVQRIRAVQYRLEPEKVVRIAADLKGQIRYEVVQTPEGISLTLQGVAPVVAAPAPVPEVAQPEEKLATAPPPAPAPEPAQLAEGPPVAPPAPRVVQAPAAAIAPPEGPARLSMDFKDADINNLLRIIAEVSEQNIVSGQDVKGKVTVRLVDVPWDQALDNILRINGFGFVREDNIIRVAKLSSIRKEQQDQLELLRIEEEAPSEPLRTEILRVSYADPKQIVQNLSKVKSKRGVISVDDRTASLIIQDTETKIEAMRAVLEALDQPTPQVMIEGRIVTVDSDHTRELGVQWGFQRSFPSTRRPTSGKFVLSDVFGSQSSTIGENTVTGAGPVSALGSIPAAFNFPVSGPTAALSFILGRIDNRLRLGARISALESESKLRTLSTPRIVALDNQEAEIKQGEEIPFTTVDSSGRTTVAFKEAVLSLKVTPHITADGRVSMQIEVTNDDQTKTIDLGGLGFQPVFNRRTATSSLLVDDGATFVIGGVRKSTEEVKEDRTPFLGKIPILGWLFKFRKENIRPKTTELLIFITPTIIKETRQARP